MIVTVIPRQVEEPLKAPVHGKTVCVCKTVCIRQPEGEGEKAEHGKELKKRKRKQNAWCYLHPGVRQRYLYQCEIPSMAIYTQMYITRQSRDKHPGVCICTQVRIVTWQLYIYTRPLHPLPAALNKNKKIQNINIVLPAWLYINLWTLFRHIAIALHHEVMGNHASKTVFTHVCVNRSANRHSAKKDHTLRIFKGMIKTYGCFSLLCNTTVKARNGANDLASMYLLKCFLPWCKIEYCSYLYTTAMWRLLLHSI